MNLNRYKHGAIAEGDKAPNSVLSLKQYLLRVLESFLCEETLIYKLFSYRLSLLE